MSKKERQQKQFCGNCGDYWPAGNGFDGMAGICGRFYCPNREAIDIQARRKFPFVTLIKIPFPWITVLENSKPITPSCFRPITPNDLEEHRYSVFPTEPNIPSRCPGTPKRLQFPYDSNP